LAITFRLGYNPKKPPEEQEGLEDEIDQLVYELYGFTKEGIKVVERR
jgi:hypothetical protein